jgi:hypothetical protein
MLESTIEEYLRQRVLSCGGACQKVIDKSRRGHPDREVQWPYPLKCMGLDKVELKKPNEPPEDHQTRYLEDLAKCGVPVYLIDTKAKVDEYIKARIAGEEPYWLRSVRYVVGSSYA